MTPCSLDEDDDLLDALEASLGTSGARQVPEAPPRDRGDGGAGAAGAAVLGRGLVLWPVEVRLCVASFLPWREFVADTLICRSWRDLGRDDVVWQAHFRATWPRLARRWAAGPGDRAPRWRSLFRERWAAGHRGEDALEEDWLDFSVAEASGAEGCSRTAAEAAAALDRELGLQQAVRRCREELLRSRGVRVPAEAVLDHCCTKLCVFHRVGVEGDAFLCQGSGRLHVCCEGEPCDACMGSNEEFFLVCPASGRCWPRPLQPADGKEEGPEQQDWDPELSAAQQHGLWFELGYGMSDAQADDFFGPSGSRRAPARVGAAPRPSGGGGAASQRARQCSAVGCAACQK
ncbi:unnamed protein product [Prorocentrum cordatum]|uniref:F-box domain-containing protein n=1 Tax=Prorocentrum cordatum TaxID=2364126 RepID=A0ABN9SVT7_9DINO|nr:unnamed protein product [Polarella glacialis]